MSQRAVVVFMNHELTEQKRLSDEENGQRKWPVGLDVSWEINVQDSLTYNYIYSTIRFMNVR